MRPVLMTAITTIFGLIPLALSSATVANVYIDSIAVAVIGGLATSSLFTLLALPVWYSTLEDAGTLLVGLIPRRSGRTRLAMPAGGVLVSDDAAGEPVRSRRTGGADRRSKGPAPSR